MPVTDTVPCRLCGQPTKMLRTKLCDRCWHVERAVQSQPELAIQVLIEMGRLTAEDAIRNV